jgi:CheY-like chemotaxis protein
MAKILIVEDDLDIRNLLTRLLRSAGHVPAVATDAVTAIGIARKEQPDVILLDLGLPGGNGLVVMERLQSIAPLSTIPVIVVSASDPATYGSLAAAGARAFVRKPIDTTELLSAIADAS